ncbi:MAG: pyruvate, phosphate dikinase [Gemmatimonadota bacterium]|nr:MAG: pyruvate, phosphate dikinase [Gemmatimonadota bacterium]
MGAGGADAPKPWVWSFSEGDPGDKQLLGGKGANLCEMTQIGLNVPPGFVVTTEACLAYLESPDGGLPDGTMEQVRAQMARLEERTGRRFGGTEDPLLVSVRSGSALSMPGMMDTILNLGLNEESLDGLIAQTGDARFAYDAYRRLIQLFGKVALGIDDAKFDEQFESVKELAGATVDVELTAEDLEEIVRRFLQVVRKHSGRAFPSDPHEQLEMAIKAVFGSWMGRRAVDYRREFGITPDMANGTAANVVAMVFGNMGPDCCTGVAFTRDPGTGANELYGEYLVNAQGEDVVAGIRTPKPIAGLASEMPDIHAQLQELRRKLEEHYREVQDFEFTNERSVLYCLQTRNGKMNASARVRTSVEMLEEGLIGKEEALLRVGPEDLEQMLYPRIDPSFEGDPLATGLAASPGAAFGQAVFDADKAEFLGRQGIRVILVREETKPEDIHGFFAAQGILTSRGGGTSHAAVVARGMGKPCVAGADGLLVDEERGQAIAGEVVVKQGDVITIDGSTGRVFLGEVPTVEAEFSEELETLLSWADEAARLQVMANADTPEDAERAIRYGAMGIGLCRTERMFNAPERLPIVLDMIIAEDDEQRAAALERLLPMQRADFRGIFQAMSPRPVTIRLLDPPIHEFLPAQTRLEEEIRHLLQLRDALRGMDVMTSTLRALDETPAGAALPPAQFGGELADARRVDRVIARKEALLVRSQALRETNPMLGHRGVRLGLTYPEIYRMQVRAILEAAAECLQDGIEVHPQIMVPQVCTSQELMRVREYVAEAEEAVRDKYELEVDFSFGTMIEVVRACLRAESLAEAADFFSFGTNDLTQATFSFSREDAETKFLPLYNERGILQDNPFEVLDRMGLGRLMALTVEWGRSRKPDLEVGICGEHGGHPDSVRFCHRIGLDYVSCSPPRIPVARLAAAHASVEVASAR